MQEIVQKPQRSFLVRYLMLALPIMGQTLMIAAMQVVDNVLVGQLQQGRALLGEYTISGVAQANKIAFLFQMAAFGMAGGASAFFAQFWGGKNQEGVDRTLSLGIAAGLIAALVFAIPSIFASEWGASPAALLHRGPLVRRHLPAHRGPFLLPLRDFLDAVRGAQIHRAGCAANGRELCRRGDRRADELRADLRKVRRAEAGGDGRGGGVRAGRVGGAGDPGGRGLRQGLYQAPVPREPVQDSGGVHPEVYENRAARGGNEMLWALGVVAYSASYGNMQNAAAATSAVIVYSNVEQLASVILRGTTQAAAIMIGMSIGAGREAAARRDAWRCSRPMWRSPY
jgi:hypothetical protein